MILVRSSESRSSAERRPICFPILLRGIALILSTMIHETLCKPFSREGGTCTPAEGCWDLLRCERTHHKRPKMVESFSLDNDGWPRFPNVSRASCGDDNVTPPHALYPARPRQRANPRKP